MKPKWMTTNKEDEEYMRRRCACEKHFYGRCTNALTDSQLEYCRRMKIPKTCFICQKRHQDSDNNNENKQE